MAEKSQKNIENTCKGWFVPDGILGNVLMTLIDLVS